MKTLLLILVSILFLGLSLRAEDPAEAEKTFALLLKAQETKDYDAFVVNGADQLKAALSKTQFEASSDILNARFKDGYESTYLGELKMRGVDVYLFRLRFKDGGDDILGTLSLKDLKVAGIYFK